MNDPQAYLGRLKPIYIFKGLTDEQILRVAEELEVERHPPETTIFEPGDEGEDFFIINAGQVNVLREERGHEPAQLASLVSGDFFGEGALLYGRRRSATVETVTDVELLRLTKESFQELLREFPQIRPNLLLSHQSHELYHRHPLRWLHENEVVYLITRRHQIVMLQRLLLPAALAAIIGLTAMWLAAIYDQLWIAWAGAAALVPIALWMLWVYIDWTNDYFIVTNQRLVHLEKVLAIYDSRQEAPLASIISVNVRTDDVLQRLLRMGDVVVRTFSGPITLSSVPNPAEFAAAVEQYWARTRTRAREEEIKQIEQMMRERLHTSPRQPAPTLVKQQKPEVTISQVKPLARRLLEFFSLQLRYQEGETVIYRKHWFILGLHIWKPTLAILALVVVTTLAVAGLFTVPFASSAVLLTGLALLVPLAAWWLYEFIDWRNDIYMVTQDQIFDVTKKPLGTETKKAAPLGNVLSLKYDRPGLLGVVLNFGTVVAQVAGAEFRFEGVYDPMAVQNDVYRRLEAFNNRQKAKERDKVKDEIADWFATYHKLQPELDEQPPAAPVDERGAASTTRRGEA
jgi:CRP-like cAMP-binding protein